MARYPGSRYGKVHPKNRALVFKRDGLRCKYCGCTCIHPDQTYQGNPRAATIDHKIPRSMEGDNRPSNLVTACFDCNNKKGGATDFDPTTKYRDNPPLVSGEAARELARQIIRQNIDHYATLNGKKA